MCFSDVLEARCAIVPPAIKGACLEGAFNETLPYVVHLGFYYMGFLEKMDY